MPNFNMASYTHMGRCGVPDALVNGVVDVPKDDVATKAILDLCGAEESLAITLLQSTDAKVAAAAKRIFSGNGRSRVLEAKPYQQTFGFKAEETVGYVSDNSVRKTPSSVVPDLSKSSVMTYMKPFYSAPCNVVPVEVHASPPPKINLEDFANSTKHKRACPTNSNSMYMQRSAPTGFSQSYSIGITSKSKVANISNNQDEVKRKYASTERLTRSRERNRIHARKTRQRKKEHMSKLRGEADKLKQEHLRLRQLINEKNTANILLVMGGNCVANAPCAEKDMDGKCSASSEAQSENIDFKVETLLKRPLDSIPDPSKITELPTLYLPGQHSQGKKIRAALALSEVALGCKPTSPQHNGCMGDDPQTSPLDSIDYGLLGKDRSTCTSEELDKIRRERNRMHAKRTRDRKRVYMEEMEGLIDRLQEENDILEQHYSEQSGRKAIISPLSNEVSNNKKSSVLCNEEYNADQPISLITNLSSCGFSPINQPHHLISNDQLKSLSAAACTFEQRMKESDVSATGTSTTAASSSSDDEYSGHKSLCVQRKKQKC